MTASTLQGMTEPQQPTGRETGCVCFSARPGVRKVQKLEDAPLLSLFTPMMACNFPGVQLIPFAYLEWMLRWTWDVLSDKPGVDGCLSAAMAEAHAHEIGEAVRRFRMSLPRCLVALSLLPLLAWLILGQLEFWLDLQYTSYSLIAIAGQVIRAHLGLSDTIDKNISFCPASIILHQSSSLDIIPSCFSIILDNPR